MPHIMIGPEGAGIIADWERELLPEDSPGVFEVPQEVANLIEKLTNSNHILAQHASNMSERVQENILPLMSKAFKEGVAEQTASSVFGGAVVDPYEDIMKKKAEMLMGGDDD